MSHDLASTQLVPHLHNPITQDSLDYSCRPYVKITLIGPQSHHLHLQSLQDNLSEHIVRSPPEVYKLLQKGAVNRTTAATKLNHESSRSHAVFTIIVEHSELNIASEEWGVVQGCSWVLGCMVESSV